MTTVKITVDVDHAPDDKHVTRTELDSDQKEALVQALLKVVRGNAEIIDKPETGAMQRRYLARQADHCLAMARLFENRPNGWMHIEKALNEAKAARYIPKQGSER